MENSVLLSAPGYYYAFAYWLSCVLFIQMNPAKWKKVYQSLICAMFLFLIVGFAIVTDTNLPVYYLPCILAVFAMMLMLLFICCEISLQNVVYFGIRAFILGEFAASIEWQCYYYQLQIITSEHKEAASIMTMVGIHGIVFFLMYILERKFHEPNAALKITGAELARALLIAVGMYLISNISNVYQNTPFSSQFPAEIYLIRTLVDFGGVMMIYAYHMQLHELYDKMEIEMLQQMMESQYNNYRTSEQSIAMVNQKYHDLKHQIAFLRDEIRTEEKIKYLNQMEEEIQAFEAQCDSGNKILDTTLMAKSLQCQNQQITLTSIVDGKAVDFMNPMDLSALFGNLLDNAIESTLQLADPAHRFIHVSVAAKKSFAIINVGNTYMGEIIFKDGLPQTTKRDKRLHGYGIKSIQDIIKRYEGGVTFSAKEGWFEMKATIPIKEELW